MVFCNQLEDFNLKHDKISHNPYFNRWFSAIQKYIMITLPNGVTILILIDGFLQLRKIKVLSHIIFVTILILIDGFLQYN